MTLHEIASQIISLTGGHLGEFTLTASEFEESLKKSFAPGAAQVGAVYTVSLPDGDWYCEISRYADRKDGFDYYIPETRWAEDRLIEMYGLEPYFVGEPTKKYEEPTYYWQYKDGLVAFG